MYQTFAAYVWTKCPILFNLPTLLNTHFLWSKLFFVDDGINILSVEDEIDCLRFMISNTTIPVFVPNQVGIFLYM